MRGGMLRLGQPIRFVASGEASRQLYRWGGLCNKAPDQVEASVWRVFWGRLVSVRCTLAGQGGPMAARRVSLEGRNRGLDNCLGGRLGRPLPDVGGASEWVGSGSTKISGYR